MEVLDFSNKFIQKKEPYYRLFNKNNLNIMVFKLEFI